MQKQLTDPDVLSETCVQAGIAFDRQRPPCFGTIVEELTDGWPDCTGCSRERFAAMIVAFYNRLVFEAAALSQLSLIYGSVEGFNLWDHYRTIRGRASS